ncbi:putative gustatory receptor clone PTE01, partial [Sus scrofa]|uniref:putative gustatory receptor clone PTE01 n=1 Tax=Sus scrofa TaxID=9823 RepID=UPI000A2B2DA4
TPMYYFLSNLSLADISTTTVPKMLVNLQTHSKSITYAGCLTQVMLFPLFACLESLLLTVMAYDRLVAICHPLHYLVIMNPHLCGFLVLLSFSISLLDSQLHYLMMSQLTFCADVEIPHFFCELSQLLSLACSDISISIILMYFIGTILAGIPFSGILYSYSQILFSILRISSSGGRYKVFSTCGSHLSIVCLFFVTGLGVYLSSAVSSSSRKGAVVSMMYTVVIPMLNPFIYSLRNRDIKHALWRIISRHLAQMDHPCDNRDKNLVALMDGRMNGEESSSSRFSMGMTMVYTTEVTVPFEEEEEKAELRYMPNPVP